MSKSTFKDSLKALEADIQHANTLALDYPRDNGACLQMRLSVSPVAHLFLFLIQWTDCHFAGALGLLRILIYTVPFLSCCAFLFVFEDVYSHAGYLWSSVLCNLGGMRFILILQYGGSMMQTYADGKTTMSVYERKASIREFYAVIFPSLLQLQKGITDLEERKQRAVCSSRYRMIREDMRLSELDLEREEECGICLETANSKVVLPYCCHSLCIKCYENWRRRSQSCPFCRDSLKRVDSDDLWIYTDARDVVELPLILKEDRQRLFMYIDKLPLVVPESVLASYNNATSHLR